MSELRTENESIVKTLLTSTTPLNLSSKVICSTSVQKPIIPTSSKSYIIPPITTNVRSMDDLQSKTHNYFNQFTGLVEKEPGIIAMDHCYARPLNWTPESAFFQPTKNLFMPQGSFTEKIQRHLQGNTDDSEDIIDVESVPLDQLELYDKSKAIQLMNECERHATFAKVNQDEEEDWEDNISRLNWTATQTRLFNGIVNILNHDHLARLAYTNNYHEPVLRRVVIDKSVKRVRYLFSSILWDSRLTQWLHQLLIDNLSTSYLTAYLDILQTLKAKLPTFVDKMLYGPNASNRVGATSNESLFHLLRRSWDPFSSYLAQNKPRKLPGNPIIIIVPSAPTAINLNQYKRFIKWTNLLSNLATVVNVQVNIGSTANRPSMINCADQMLTASRVKVQEVKNDFPGRPIILIGFNAGSALALQVAQVEHITCVVCLGFSLLTFEGKRGDPDDNLLELQCPVLFVIGQCSNTSFPEDVEDLRERMRVENGLIVVGSADDYLRVTKKKKRAEGITQSAVDRIIVENIGEFISGLLLSPYPPQLRQSPMHAAPENSSLKRTKVERKRNNSNGSSIDSEPPSPTPKITRPVGRPPGSKSKTKLDAKWVTQGIPSPIPDPSSQSFKSYAHDSLPNSSLLSQPEISSVDKSPHKKSFELPNIGVDGSTKSNNLQNKVASSTAAKMGFNRSVLTSGNTYSSIQQISLKPNIGIPQSNKQGSGIKVLENLTLNNNSSTKLISNTSRSFDLSKITLLNSVNTIKTGSSVGNVVLLPDGKIKSIGSTAKGSGNTPIILPMSSNRSKIAGVPSQNSRMTKYITSKKQLIGRKPPPVTTKPSIVSSFTSNLPPPTNLTTQDIMDLPIIFADDNQMFTDNSKLQQPDIVPLSEVVQPIQIPKSTQSNPVGKYVFINKQLPIQTVSVSSSNSNTVPILKRTATTVPSRTTVNPQKYMKIILSTRSIEESKTTTATAFTKITNLSPEISIKKIEPATIETNNTLDDLEKAIVSTTIKKPEYHIATIKGTISKTPETNILKTEESHKRTIDDAKLSEVDDVLFSKTARIITSTNIS